MPKKSGKNKKQSGDTKRVMEYASEVGQVYGVVTRALGDRTFTVNCVDNTERRCKVRIRSRTLRREFNGVVVVVALRDFDDKNGDIVWVYDSAEARILKSRDLIPDWSNTSTTTVEDIDADKVDAFEFADI